MMGNKTRAVCLRVVELFFLVAAVVMLTAVASEAEAQGEPPLLTLQQSIEIALERNFDMQLAREEIHAAQDTGRRREPASCRRLAAGTATAVPVRFHILCFMEHTSIPATGISTV